MKSLIMGVLMLGTFTLILCQETETDRKCWDRPRHGHSWGWGWGWGRGRGRDSVPQPPNGSGGDPPRPFPDGSDGEIPRGERFYRLPSSGNRSRGFPFRFGNGRLGKYREVLSLHRIFKDCRGFVGRLTETASRMRLAGEFDTCTESSGCDTCMFDGLMKAREEVGPPDSECFTKLDGILNGIKGSNAFTTEDGP